jgi:hypothetical protein
MLPTKRGASVKVEMEKKEVNFESLTSNSFHFML